MDQGSEDRLAYRIVFDLARRFIESSGRNGTTLSPYSDRDMSLVVGLVVQQLEWRIELLDTKSMSGAICDAMLNRPPRW